MKVAHVRYPGFTALDVVGAFQVFAGAPDVDPVFVALEPGPVVDDSGRCPLDATEAAADVLAADVAVVPGSERGGESDAAVLAWLRLTHPTTHFTVSVGTRALWLAAASLLEAGEAATHWASAEKLRRFGVRHSDERVVQYGKIITAAGSSAGIDMALTVVGLTHGTAIAQAVQLVIQYDPEPPSTPGPRPKRPPRSASSCTPTRPCRIYIRRRFAKSLATPAVTHRTRSPHRMLCSTVAEDASFAGGCRPAAQARCPRDPTRGASQ